MTRDEIITLALSIWPTSRIVRKDAERLERFAAHIAAIERNRIAAETLAETASRAVVPEGWKLVPVEPTYRMLEEAQKAWLSDPCRRTSTLYKAMIAASEKGSGDADN